ncbi:hypothetical protein A2379_05100 [Candidatus Amesbacteria bacterium RIFOXYB1_FULL_47_13]|nr:MAG: hypothetical protein UW51_C0003G0045 [Candidatus Amesbacteria bacterium GW2011_GWA1_44_24]KKU31470.1 MAG: hypothetical protein UX46_C0005G0039 [Candidatus Amesbacteria bacterium GW2011_GWC1_46_24]OGD05127.1 MAG: hypothetical protein A2379_05100 [Candidatus Amesbacteria bacterium RIFOXYB1_FULL_47_13]
MGREHEEYIQAVGMQGNVDGIMEQGQVEGNMEQAVTVGSGKARIRKRVKARVVLTPEGTEVAIGGGTGQPISVGDARRVLGEGEVLGLVTDALRRERNNRKKKKLSQVKKS